MIGYVEFEYAEELAPLPPLAPELMSSPVSLLS